MSMMRKRRLLPMPMPILLMLAIGGAAPGLCAQPGSDSANTSVIYTCTDDRGRRITSDRPIADCTAKEQRVLNKDGSLKAIYPPILTADERAEKEASERRLAELRAEQADAIRRDRNLLQRYPAEARHRKAREAALDTVRQAMKTTEARLRTLRAERVPLMTESEFYLGKPLPPKLRGLIEANDTATEAQREVALNQEAELDRINRLYDAELARLRLLWAGAAPGSMGVLALPGGVTPVASSASSPKTSALR